ncbi:MAG: M6 family metalloprotease domain-containing protein [Chthonomonas sp.]|nr:M6 family metalloprotease domain-containing protein [Chthonomonas sp.]
MIARSSLCALSLACAGAAFAHLPWEIPNLAGYKTTATATRAQVATKVQRTTLRVGYLGMFVEQDKATYVVEELDEAGPAAAAGIEVGDVVLNLGGYKAKDQSAFRNHIQGLEPDSTLSVEILRGGKKQKKDVKVGSTSRPKLLSDERPVMGVLLGDATPEGVAVRRVTPDSPADKGGLKTSDIVTKLDGTALVDPARLEAFLDEKAPGQVVTVTYLREGKTGEAKVTLGEPPQTTGGAQTFSPRNVWKKDVYKLAIIGMDYADVKHNDKISREAWADSLFSTGTYTGESATGEKVYGSLNDFYQEVSVKSLRVEGKVFEPVLLTKNRMDYQEGNGTGNRSRQMLFNETLDAVIKRDGETALDGYDGIFFLFSGGRVQTSRGSVYWPHRSSHRYKNKTWPYFIIQEGGQRMTDISVMAHEFGHMIGWPDLYARPENPGSEGLGTWCLMSNQTGAGRPQHPSAWCKIQQGWLDPVVIDPSVPQKLILSPVNGSKTECYKVLLRPDGAEYLLLENRRKTGFDTSLSSEGMLIWHVAGNTPTLIESHGVEGPSGPRVYLNSVPFPSGSNTSFTPFTTPSSRSKFGGGAPVHITNIRQLEDGRVTFWIGYEMQ